MQLFELLSLPDASPGLLLKLYDLKSFPRRVPWGAVKSGEWSPGQDLRSDDSGLEFEVSS